ncbi:MAG: hypothetical protein ABSD70_01960 [Terracidiphilus sp.]|jgi:hypothetical protein
MKKLVFATAMALTGMSLVSTPALRAQDAGQNIQIQDPAEFNAYQSASTQTDPAQKCTALESFIKTYPQSVVKKLVLDQMIDCYQQSNNTDGALGATSRLLQVDPNNMKAIFLSVYLKKQQCAKSVDATGVATDSQTCDDSGALAQKGLTAPKPAAMSDGDWKNLTANAYPIFHSAIAFDDAVSKKDFSGAIDEYTKELMLYPPDACTKPGPCLADTLQLAQAYAKPGPARDQVKAVWFFARAWDYAPPAFKTQIEPQLEYWYKRYHGTLDGDAAIKQQLDGIKGQAQATLFPPQGFVIAPAPSNQDLANKYCAVSTDDLKKLALEDKEFILTYGSKDCTDKLWGLMKDQPTPVPGIVIAAQATVLKISATLAASPKPKDFVVKLTTPGVCSSVPPSPSDLKIKDAQAYILANGVKADTDALGDVLTDTPVKLHKLSVQPAVTAFNVAVTQDAKDAHTADFTVNMKEPVACAEAPAAGTALGLQPAEQLDGTYDTYTQTPASGSTPASSQIVLRDGSLEQEVKKGPPVHHPAAAKPSAAHHAQ